ncbi:hypothetical protein ABZV31_16715 [Streptomyces sp. NPDC005202]|uniref:hypothetical protein n=1 Tax=Streptomyces sp. NPDC005202 TaxID=3157021 RepID=UPI0033BEA868
MSANGPRGGDWGDVWLRDRRTGALTQIDRSRDGAATERESLAPAISGDGRTVVLESADTHLVPDDTDRSWNVFAYDVASGANTRIHGSQGGSGEVYTCAPPSAPTAATSPSCPRSPSPAAGGAPKTPCICGT